MAGDGDGAGELNSGEGMLAGGECMVGWPNFGEAAAVGGDCLFGFSPAEVSFT